MMPIRHLQDFRDPYSHEALRILPNKDALASSSNEFAVVGEVPRFVRSDNYAESFGIQWQEFSRTQLDSSANWAGHSEKRLFEETRWSRDLQGQRILEAGSGMGRFTEVLGKTGAHVCTFDYSAAINANLENNRQFENISYAQADIYHPPYEPGSFDKVLCLGVLQHCPAPKAAFLKLTEFLKPGGEIVIDVYRLSWKSLFLGKYFMRPITRQLPSRLLRRCVRAHVAMVYPLTGMVHRIIGPAATRLSFLLGMADYRGRLDADEGMLRELAELDTFDMLAPTYDRPQTIATIRQWFAEAKLERVEVVPGYNGIEGRGTRAG